jgi:hypothetical protein
MVYRNGTDELGPRPWQAGTWPKELMLAHLWTHRRHRADPMNREGRTKTPARSRETARNQRMELADRPNRGTVIADEDDLTADQLKVLRRVVKEAFG